MKKNKFPKCPNCETNKYVTDIYGDSYYHYVKKIKHYACYNYGIPFRVEVENEK